MHPDFERADKLSHAVIGAAMEVHSTLGPGLIESIYEKCLVRELELRRISAVRQERVAINYKGFVFEETLRFDILVEGCLLIEGKAAEKIVPVHKAQLMSYMKLLNAPLGLIFNFHEEHLRNGIVRLILPRAGRS